MNFGNLFSVPKVSKTTILSIVAISSTAIISVFTYQYYKKNYLVNFNSSNLIENIIPNRVDSKYSDNLVEDISSNNNDNIEINENGNIEINENGNIEINENGNIEINENGNIEINNDLLSLSSILEQTSDINNDSNPNILTDTHLINVYPILIGCNYKNTPYQVQNCINNTKLINDILIKFNSKIYKFENTNIITDDMPEINNIINIIQNIYNKSKDNDFVFIYYSGYCDKDIDTDDDLLTLSCKDDESFTIKINKILNIFENDQIKLIFIIDGFYYDKLSDNVNCKSNHVIVSSFVNESNKIQSSTNFTEKICDIIEKKHSIDLNHQMWNNIQILGNKDIIADL